MEEESPNYVGSPPVPPTTNTAGLDFMDHHTTQFSFLHPQDLHQPIKAIINSATPITSISQTYYDQYFSHIQ